MLMNQYYDPILESIRLDTEQKLEEQANEFRDWLIEYGFLNEETQQNWYIKWKNSTISNLRTNLNKFLAIATQEIGNNYQTLEANKVIILNSKIYPVKASMSIEDAPNYKEAIQRISRPLSNSLNGLNLQRIEIPDDKAATTEATKVVNNTNRDPEGDNTWLKKMIIPIYDPKEGFSESAKKYFTGGDNRQYLGTQALQSIMQPIYEFCSNYNTISRSLNTDLNGIISFVNKDPTTGQQYTNSNTDLQMMQKAQGMKPAASTNPIQNITGGNAVNADTDYSLFVDKYFESINEAEQSRVQGNVGNVQTADNTRAANTAYQTRTAYTMKQPNTTTNGNNDQTQQQNSTNNSKPSDQGQLMAKKKQVACEIVKEAFEIKISSMQTLFNTFIRIMNTHISNYTIQQ